MPTQQQLATELISFGISKTVDVPPEAQFTAALIGGLVAGFAVSPQISTSSGFLNVIACDTKEGSVVSDEALEIFKHVICQFRDTGAFASQDPLGELVELITNHPAAQNPRNLVNCLPDKAIPLVSALGVLIAVTIQ